MQFPPFFCTQTPFLDPISPQNSDACSIIWVQSHVTNLGPFGSYTSIQRWRGRKIEVLPKSGRCDAWKGATWCTGAPKQDSSRTVAWDLRPSFWMIWGWVNTHSLKHMFGDGKGGIPIKTFRPLNCGFFSIGGWVKTYYYHIWRDEHH